MKSAIKLRRDSGLADTSDAEADCKIEPTDYEPSCDIKNLSNEFDDESNENLRSVLNIVDTDENDNAPKDDEKKSELECENVNDENKQQLIVDERENDSRSRETVKSMLNIIIDKKATNETLEPAIWESEASTPPDPDTKAEENKQNPHKSIDCDNVKHNTNLYDPEKLNKGHYPEVKFKNDLIFDLDM